MKIKIISTYFDMQLNRDVLEGEILEIEDIERCNLLIRRGVAEEYIEEVKTTKRKRKSN